MIAKLHEILDVGFKMDVLLFHWDFKLLSGDGGLCNREWLKHECEHIEKESGKKQRERAETILETDGSSRCYLALAYQYLISTSE